MDDFFHTGVHLRAYLAVAFFLVGAGAMIQNVSVRRFKR